jgi:predicted dehydrogenase
MAKSTAKKTALVVGCGGMGRAWMKNIQDNPRAALIGVVDVRQEAAQAAAKDFGLPPERAFTDVKAAIRALSPDFVCDITIPEAHCPTTVAALGAGVPVIGEKPLAASMAEARKMVAAAKKSGLTSMVSQSRRYDANHVAIRDAVRKGVIGEVTTINCDFFIGAHFGGFRDAMESPLILDMSIHHFDQCRFFFDADPVSVYCHEFNPKGSWYKGDVAASAIFELANGAVFTYRGSWCAEGLHTSWNGDWRIIGERGTITYDHDRAPVGERVKKGAKPGFFLDKEPVALPVPTINGVGIAGSLNEFLDHLQKGKPVQCETKDNIKSLAMVFAAMKSARSGRKEKVSW